MTSKIVKTKRVRFTFDIVQDFRMKLYNKLLEMSRDSRLKNILNLANYITKC